MYDDMLAAFNRARSAEMARSGPTYTFGSSGTPINDAGANPDEYSNPESYNPPNFSTVDMVRAKRNILSRGLKASVWDFVERTCLDHNIDPSHGLEHACRVAMWCFYLFAEISNEINPFQLSIGIADLQDVVVSGGFLHDALDDKYIQPNDMITLQTELRGILLSEYDDVNVVNAIIGAINCISFSARYELMSEGEHPIPPRMQVGDEEHPMTNLCRVASHIIADSDMLDAYNPMRCRDFRIHKNHPKYTGWETNPVARRELHAGVGGIIRNRVLYYHDVYLFTKAAKKYATQLHMLAWQWAVAETGDIPDHELTYHPGGAPGNYQLVRIDPCPVSSQSTSAEVVQSIPVGCMQMAPNDDQRGGNIEMVVG